MSRRDCSFIACGSPHRTTEAEGKTWGGSKPGRLLSVTKEQVAAIHRMCDEGTPKAKIARAAGVSRPTVYRVIEQRREGQILAG